MSTVGPSESAGLVFLTLIMKEESNVEISKNELVGALSALGKLVCRTSPVEA